MAERGEIILHIGGGEADRRARTSALRSAGFDVREAVTGQDALRLAAQEPGLIVLDALLPDADGPALGRRLKADPRTAAVPLLLLAADADPEVAADACLAPSVEPAALVAIVRALLRARRAEQAEAHARAHADRAERLEQERRLLEQFAALPPAAVTARLYGALSLREAAPAAFAEAAGQYEHVLDLALEQRDYKVSHQVSERLRALGDQLGFLRAGPRDVVEIHGAALKKLRNRSAPLKTHAYFVEARLLLLELMGHLAAYYRGYYLGARPGAAGETSDRRPNDEGHHGP